jgi:phosphoenolpyruvate synthase/pyruvate phosphate dikinase
MQIQINPVVSGIMFTADVVTGLRNVTVIDAGFGLGEALVSGLINPDVYKYDQKRKVLEKKIEIQNIEVIPTFGQLNRSDEYNIGGTKTIKVEKSRREIQKLTDGQIGTLVYIGTGVHFGRIYRILMHGKVIRVISAVYHTVHRTSKKS